MAPSVWQTMHHSSLQTFANANSLHPAGQQARALWQQALQQLADSLDAPAESLVITSGGTESNNAIIVGRVQAWQAAFPGRRPHLICSSIEHSAVLEPMRHLAQQGQATLTVLPVDATGRVSASALEAALTPDTALVSLMWVNNETGVMQDLDVLGRLLRERGVAFHTDGVQGIGKWPVSLQQWPVDYVSASAHKFYGPKGVGFLYTRPGAPAWTPWMLGGSQQQGRRGGTVNVAGAVGMAAALAYSLEQGALHRTRLEHLTSWFIQQLTHRLGQYGVINTPLEPAQRLPGVVNVAFPPVQGETWVLRLGLQGIAVSSGSACHAGIIHPSSVVQALGQDAVTAQATVRFSMGWATTQQELETVLQQLQVLVPKLVDKHRKS